MAIVLICLCFATGSHGKTVTIPVKAVGVADIGGLGKESELEWPMMYTDETGRPVQPPMPVFTEATTIYVEMNDTKLAIGQAKQAAGLTPANDEKPPEVTLSASTDGDRWPHARPPRKDDTAEDERNNISYPSWGSICNCGNGSSCKASHTVVGNGLNTSTIKFTSTTPCDHFIFVACGNSRKVIRVVFYQVDVNVNNTCGMHEISPGALIPFNCDWDCTRHYTAGSEAPEPGMYPTPATLLRSGIDKVEGEIVWDYEYADSCNNENDLKSVTVSVKPNTMTGKFTINYGDSDITLWEAYRKNQVMPQMPTMPGQPERPWPPYEDPENSAHDTGVVPSDREYDLAKLGSNSLSLCAEGLKVGSSMILVTFAGSVKSNAADAVANSSIVHVNGTDGVTVNSVEMVARQGGARKIINTYNMPVVYSVDSISTGYNYNWTVGTGDDHFQPDIVLSLAHPTVSITYNNAGTSNDNVQLLEQSGNERKTYNTAVILYTQKTYKNNDNCCGQLVLTLPVRVALAHYVEPKTIASVSGLAARQTKVISLLNRLGSGHSFANVPTDIMAAYQTQYGGHLVSFNTSRLQYSETLNANAVTLFKLNDSGSPRKVDLYGTLLSARPFEESWSDKAVYATLAHEGIHCTQRNQSSNNSNSDYYKMYQNVYLTENLYSFFEAEAYFNTMNNGQDWLHIKLASVQSNYENAMLFIDRGNELYKQTSVKFMRDIYKNCYFNEMKRDDYDHTILPPLTSSTP
ncbi:hypothetical protein [Victivallis sp. Marseille-Q1083]|uniref:hypothetical protein n=1 Tax=Victivallis sp. Marseille-Q1083 TaxID=2717288 RepID=UPI001589EAC5|nr:hypothetical protein [Victivallis sp. Marseille-Q1083]